MPSAPPLLHRYVKGEIPLLPWSELEGGLTVDSEVIRQQLVDLNSRGGLARAMMVAILAGRLCALRR